MDPCFILHRVAAFRFHFVTREKAALLPAFAHSHHVGAGSNLNTHVGLIAAFRPLGLIQREVERRIGDIKFRVPGADLAGFDPKQFAVEINALGDILNVNGDVGFQYLYSLRCHTVLPSALIYVPWHMCAAYAP